MQYFSDTNLCVLVPASGLLLLSLSRWFTVQYEIFTVSVMNESQLGDRGWSCC